MRKVVAVAAAFTTLFVAEPKVENQVAEKSQDSSVTVRTLYSAMGLLAVHVLEFDPDLVEMRLLFPGAAGKLEMVKNMEGCAGSRACFNTSFFRETNAPIGLMVSGGHQYQPVKNVSWGVFWVGKDKRARIYAKKQFLSEVEPDEVEFAVQSGPTVMRGGVIRDDLGGSLARRTAVGLTSSGRVVLLVFPWPVSLTSMAKFARDDVGVDTMMNLDGGSSTQLHVPGDRSMDVSGAPVAVGAALFPRIAPQSR